VDQRGLVGNWILDGIWFIRLVREVSERLGYLGIGRLRHSMSFSGKEELETLAMLPAPDFEGADNMRSVQLPEKVPDTPFPTSRDHVISATLYDEDDIIRLLADSFLYHLRGIGGNVNWEKLRTEIKYLMGNF